MQNLSHLDLILLLASSSLKEDGGTLFFSFQKKCMQDFVVVVAVVFSTFVKFSWCIFSSFLCNTSCKGNDLKLRTVTLPHIWNLAVLCTQDFGHSGKRYCCKVTVKEPRLWKSLTLMIFGRSLSAQVCFFIMSFAYFNLFWIFKKLSVELKTSVNNSDTYWIILHRKKFQTYQS